MNNNMNNMDTYRVALLIPCTSNGKQEWNSIKDSYLYNLSLKTFLLTQDKEHKYTFYIGHDNDDRIYSKKDEQSIIERFSSVFTNIQFKFIELNVKKGHLTKMWNILYQHAYDDGNDYFFQCGDDINFKTKGWINQCIFQLLKNNNIGISGPLNNNNRILTQAMFTRKHMEIFGFLFPEEIINWCCDDWYNFLYHPGHIFPLYNYLCINEGGTPRYIINNNKHFSSSSSFKKNIIELRNKTYELSLNHKKILQQYLDT